MKKHIKTTSFILIMLLIMQIIFPIITNIEIDTSYAAAITYTNGGLTYSYSNNANASLTIKGSGSVTSSWKTSNELKNFVTKVKTVVIHRQCTEIGSSAFENCSALTKVTFASGSACTTIGNNAFKNCTALTNVVTNVTTTETANYTLPASIKTIGTSAFMNTALTSINTNTGVTSIGASAFSGCTKLVTLTIGTGVTSIGASAFASAPLTTKITYNAVNCTTYNSAFKDKQAASVAIGTGVTKIPDNFINGNKAIKAITIPAKCTSIGNNAFQNCSAIATLTFTATATCTTIGNYAFDGCSALTAVTIPISVKTIGDYSFRNCTKLATVTLTKTSAVTSIGNYAFYGDTALTNIKGDGVNNTLPGALKTIGQYAFYNCTGLTTLTYGSSLTTLGNYAFSGCTNLTEFTNGTEGGMAHLNSNISSIGSYVFNNTAIENVRVLNRNATIDYNAFSGKNVRCFAGSTAASKSSKHTIFITNSNPITQTTGIQTDRTLFSGIGRYKLNYTGASSYYCANRFAYSGGISKLELNRIEYDHNKANKGNSSGAKLTLNSGSSVKKAYLLLQYNEDTAANYKLIDNWYVTLSYCNSKRTSNFTPDYSIECIPTEIMHNNDMFNSCAYIDITDFVAQRGSGYYYCSNIPTVANGPLDNGLEEAAAWKIVVIEQNRSFPLKAVVLDACLYRMSSNSKTLQISLPAGITTKSSSQAYMDILYGISNGDPPAEYANKNYVKYTIGTKEFEPTVMYNGYTIRSSKFVSRYLYTINGKPLEQITNYPTGQYIDENSLKNNTGAKFIYTANEFPITGDDAELITDLKVDGGESYLSAKVGAVGINIVLNSLGIAADIEGFNYLSTQTTIVNSLDSIIVTGKSTNTTKNANIGISNGTYTVKLDNKLTATSATATVYNNGTRKTITGTIDNTNHTVTFSGVSTLTNGTYIEYTINCTVASGATTLNNIAYYSGNYYNSGLATDYIEDATVASSSGTIKYVLTVNPNEGTWSNSTNNQTFTIAYGGTKSIVLPTRTGYTFTGWTLAGTGSTMSSLTTNNATFKMGTANATLTANWKINTSTLKVNPNGGSWEGSTAEQSFTQNYNTTKSIPVPTRTGYTFTGWTKEGTNGSLSSTTSAATYTFGTTNAVTDTLTANWEEEFTLTVNPNEGTWNNSRDIQEITLTYGETKNIELPLREGYVFTGWTLEGTETGSTMSSLTEDNATFTMGNANATLTANWEEEKYTLTVHHYLEGTNKQVPLKGGNLGQTIEDVVTENLKKGDTYQTEKAGENQIDYEIYTLVQTPENMAGTIEGNTEVFYYYQIKTTNFTMTKVAEEDHNKTIEGTQFALYQYIGTNQEEDEKELIDKNKVDLAKWKLIRNQATSSIGNISFEDLPITGTYRLVEIKSSEGRLIPDGQWNIEFVKDNEEENSVTLEDGLYLKITAIGNPPAFAIEEGKLLIPNKAYFNFPTSGAIGIKGFYQTGLILIAIGGILVFLRKTEIRNSTSKLKHGKKGNH